MFPPESIIETLWPDQDYTNHAAVVKNLVHRLRRRIDGENHSGAHSLVLHKHGCYGWNNDGDYWLDAKLFERYCREGHYLAQENASLACDYFCRALNLYIGEYIPELPYGDWVQPVRQYYRHLFLKSMTALLGIYRKQRLYSRVIETCEQIILIERFEEEFHLRYMEALFEEGKTAQALDHYEYISSLLYRELGVKPSGTMKNLYQSIKKRNDDLHAKHSDIREVLADRDSDGPFHCTPEVFKSFCAMERRRAERDNRCVYVGILTLDGHDYHLPSHVNLDESMGLLKESLACILRKGDAITRLNEMQYAILLTSITEEQALMILERVSNSFEKSSMQYELILRRSVQPILPFKLL